MGRRAAGDSRHLTQDLNEYMFWAVCLRAAAVGRRMKVQELLEMRTSLGQMRNTGLSVHLCLQHADAVPVSVCNMRTRFPCVCSMQTRFLSVCSMTQFLSVSAA